MKVRRRGGRVTRHTLSAMSRPRASSPESQRENLNGLSGPDPVFPTEGGRLVEEPLSHCRSNRARRDIPAQDFLLHADIRERVTDPSTERIHGSPGSGPFVRHR